MSDQSDYLEYTTQISTKDAFLSFNLNSFSYCKKRTESVYFQVSKSLLKKCIKYPITLKQCHIKMNKAIKLGLVCNERS